MVNIARLPSFSLVHLQLTPLHSTARILIAPQKSAKYIHLTFNTMIICILYLPKSNYCKCKIMRLLSFMIYKTNLMSLYA